MGTTAIPSADADGAVRLHPGRKLLFLDDHAIQQTPGLTRTMHRPAKRGPVLKADRPSDEKDVCAVSAPMWIPDEGVYKMVYEIRPPVEQHVRGRPGKGWALAVSEDGLDWQKPDLGLVEFEGSTRNNRFPTPDGNRLWHVVYDPDDADDRRRYKGLLRVGGGHLPVVSPDCLHWQKLEVPILPSGDAGSLTYDRDNGQFLALLKCRGRYGRAYNLATSEDFVRWSEPRFLFGTDDEDQVHAREVIRRRLCHPALARPLFVDPDPDTGWRPPAWRTELHPQARETWQAECYNIGLFPYEGVHIALLMIYYATGTSLPGRANTDGFDLIQLAMTRDLKAWERLGDRAPFIGPSPLTEGLAGNYDRLQLQPTNRPIDRGDSLWFYYEGMKRRVPHHDRWPDGSPRDPGTLSPEERADWLDDTHIAIHVAELRKDGFVSLDAPGREGHLLTEPLRFSGAALFLNLSAADGEGRVEVLDVEGRGIEGFSGSQSLPVSGDRVRLPVRWQGGGDIGQLAGQVVRLRVHLQNASLFAVWTE